MEDRKRSRKRNVRKLKDETRKYYWHGTKNKVGIIDENELTSKNILRRGTIDMTSKQIDDELNFAMYDDLDKGD